MKKLLVSVLAAGLVFPTATALAKETAVPASAPTQPEVVLHLDGNTEVKTPAKETSSELVHKATGEALTQPEVILYLDGNTEVVTTTTAKTTVATTKAPETTKKPDGKVSKATQKAKSSAKTGAKKLPKTSAAK